MRLVMRPFAVCLLAACAALSCAAPPNKEMDQARGAIEAARAAGAGQYAPTELAAATQALTQANDAVAGRDYRLALNFALESAEQALNAARTAADTRARLRGDAERSMAEVKALVAQITARLEGSAGAQVPRRTRRTAEQTLAQLEKTLQEANTALQAEDYMKAQRLLTEAKERLQGVVAAVFKPPTSQSSQRGG